MPYKSDTIKIAGTQYDSRVKLSQDAREAIKILTEHGFSQRKLAEMFNVSRRLVQMVLDPKPRTTTTSQKPTQYWTEAKRKSRAKKHELLKSGKLNITTSRA